MGEEGWVGRWVRRGGWGGGWVRRGGWGGGWGEEVGGVKRRVGRGGEGEQKGRLVCG